MDFILQFYAKMLSVAVILIDVIIALTISFDLWLHLVIVAATKSGGKKFLLLIWDWQSEPWFSSALEM